jgi:hypothetical protein
VSPQEVSAGSLTLKEWALIWTVRYYKLRLRLWRLQSQEPPNA